MPHGKSSLLDLGFNKGVVGMSRVLAAYPHYRYSCAFTTCRYDDQKIYEKMKVEGIVVAGKCSNRRILSGERSPCPL